MTTEKPNILYIVLDQWRGDCLGLADSHHPVMTPHTDQLAYEGLWFSRTYADCPICMPQRATLLTGQTGSQHGMPYNFLAGPRSPIPLDLSLPYRLTREAGYQSKAVGKMHFYPERARFGFEHITLHPNDYVNWLEEQGYGGLYRGHGVGGNEVYPAVSAVPERYTHTNWKVAEAIRFLGQRDPESPFFLWLVFEAPHSPFDPPPPYDRLYDDFDVPEAVVGEWVGTAQEPLSLVEQRLANKADRIKPDILRKLRRHYYGQITHVDYQLGLLLGELQRQGLYENTAVILTSDHGEHLGDHQLFAKYTFLESSARIPLIVKPPHGMAAPGQQVTTPTLTADIVPTLLEMAGLTPDERVGGQSLLNLPPERIIFGETRTSVFATDGRYKYIYYLDGGIEHLFDLVNDPDDRHNVAADTAVADIKNQLKQALRAYLTKYNRPAVDDNGAFVITQRTLDETAVRAKNQAAWRGPLRYGQGYG